MSGASLSGSQLWSPIENDIKGTKYYNINKNCENWIGLKYGMDYYMKNERKVKCKNLNVFFFNAHLISFHIIKQIKSLRFKLLTIIFCLV